MQKTICRKENIHTHKNGNEGLMWYFRIMNPLLLLLLWHHPIYFGVCPISVHSFQIRKIPHGRLTRQLIFSTISNNKNRINPLFRKKNWNTIAEPITTTVTTTTQGSEYSTTSTSTSTIDDESNHGGIDDNEFIFIQENTSTKMLDELIDECIRTKAEKPFMKQFDAAFEYVDMNHNERNDSMGTFFNYYVNLMINSKVFGVGNRLWKLWNGTIFAVTGSTCLYKMFYSACVYILLCTYMNQYNIAKAAAAAVTTTVTTKCNFFLLLNVYDMLSGIDILYGQILLPITTFTLTFFVDQSYNVWRKCLELSRELQGRMHDINLILAAHAARRQPPPPSPPIFDNNDETIIITNNNNPDPNVSSSSETDPSKTILVDPLPSLLANNNNYSTYTDASKQLLQIISRYIRLFNILMYSSLTRTHNSIVSLSGMKRLVQRGLLTNSEYTILMNATIPPDQRHHIVLMWIYRTFIEGYDANHFVTGCSSSPKPSSRGGGGGGVTMTDHQPTSTASSGDQDHNNCQTLTGGLEQTILDLIHSSCASYSAIGSTICGRIPLAYAHVVQVLVDLVLWMYPFMAFASGMSGFLCVLGTGLLTLGYQGLFDLSKQFLDPYGNENFGEDPLVVNTFIAETNAGSVRWMNGLEKFPLLNHDIKTGNLQQFILPVRGYSTEMADEREQQQQQQMMVIRINQQPPPIRPRRRQEV